MSNSPRILVVDDDRINRSLFEVMLQAEDFAVELAASGEAALLAVAAHAPDLILLDVLMPGMDGYQVASELKRNPLTRHIPLIMITALDDRDARMMGFAAGAENFLTKPVDRAELCVRVRNMLRLKTAADEAVAHRDAAMSMVSHELRNMLHSIVLNASLLSERAAATDATGHCTVIAQRIRKCTQRMNRLIDDLVDVVSLDAGKMAIKPVRGDAYALLVDAVDVAADNAAGKEVVLTCSTAPTLLIANFDRARINQVFANLLGNAIKFTPAGGSITVSAVSDGKDVTCTVRDTGPGIPADMIETIFTRFTQVVANAHDGLGLGLHIAKSIVESHGGRIWVESQLGHGCAFHFTIPAL
ncbi:MAG: hybrid sensor histidine kinase/response regulator [Kofleriaceae bacterium]|nr:hybrid sensor histidine kinase/response regulator [Kofleriaceae bacterium]